MNMRQIRNKLFITAILTGLLSMTLLIGTAAANSDLRPAAQTTDTPPPVTDSTPAPTDTPPPKACTECHPDKQDAWVDSPHAHSFDDPVFQEGWASMENSSDCLLCHKANYDSDNGQGVAEGVSCETCHGENDASHPPEDIPTLSDEEYCGRCHPTTLGEVRLSGHSTPNEVRCVDCHDPHSQKVLFVNPNDLCKQCHNQEELGKMDEALSQLHLQENIACATCHTLDVPHTFVINFQHEDTAQFFKGFDCTSEVSARAALKAGTPHEALGATLEDQMNWPIIHSVSRIDSAPQCSDCHVIDEKLRTEFASLGYSPEEVDTIAWEREDFPLLDETELNKLVATPRRSWSWVYWLMGVALVFGIFEFTVARKMEAGPKDDGLFSSLRKRFTRKQPVKNDDPKGKE